MTSTMITQTGTDQTVSDQTRRDQTSTDPTTEKPAAVSVDFARRPSRRLIVACGIAGVALATGVVALTVAARGAAPQPMPTQASIRVTTGHAAGADLRGRPPVAVSPELSVHGGPGSLRLAAPSAGAVTSASDRAAQRVAAPNAKLSASLG